MNAHPNEIKSDLADHADLGSTGCTNDLTKEDQDNLANFLSKVQGQQLKNEMTVQQANNALDSLTVPNIVEFDSKSAHDPSDYNNLGQI